MTIYSSKLGEKKDTGTVPPPEVVLGTEDVKEDNDPKSVVCSNYLNEYNPPTLVTVSSKPRRSGCANVCVLLTALIAVAIGIIGGIYLYKHLAQRTFRGWCGVKYYEYRDEERRAGRLQSHHQGGLYHNSRRYYGQFEERVEIDKVYGKYEKIDVPDLDECRRATIIHDFERNLTAIVDKINFHCFILPLNRTTVTPPRDFWDLLKKLSNGYYLPDAELVREHYSVVYPRIVNLGPYGYHIWRECHRFDTFHLERVEKESPPSRARRDVSDFNNSSMVEEEEDKEGEEPQSKESHDEDHEHARSRKLRKLSRGRKQKKRQELKSREGKIPGHNKLPQYNLGATGTKWDRVISIMNLREKGNRKSGHKHALKDRKVKTPTKWANLVVAAMLRELVAAGGSWLRPLVATTSWVASHKPNWLRLSNQPLPATVGALNMAAAGGFALGKSTLCVGD